MTKKRVKYMVQSIAIMAVATFLSFFLQSYGIRKENILMIYIVGVLVITVTTTGYLYGMMASVCSVLLFNYFFTVPVHTFAMTDQNDVVRLVFFLITGFISASIMVRFHNQVRIAEETRAQMEREKLKSNMLRSISHDFRTPLTGIMGAAGLLKEADELDAGVRKELAGEIQEQSVWLMRLMENILNMTKLESEEFEIRKNQEVVDDLIYEAVSHIIGLREKRRFEIKLPSELIVVNVDGKLMVQVLVNLLDNAMKHTGENGWICIEARYDAGKVWISVEDDGDGIQEDLKENIFDEFVTRSDEKGDRQRGIGLGLAICKAVVNAHGGNICAENRKEGGARFMFWLEARQVSTDGETDLLAVAVREVKEEAGISEVHPLTEKIFSMESLTVDGHVKNGRYVSSHLHLNITYLLEADPEEHLSIKEDENSGVAWFTPEEALEKSTEPWFVERVYKKLIKKTNLLNGVRVNENEVSTE